MSTGGYLTAPPVQRVIPVTKGCDVAFTLRCKDADGQPKPFGGQVYVIVAISPEDQPIRVDAMVDVDAAAVRIESPICDTVTNRSAWRAVLSRPGTPSLEIALAVGNFERRDGRV